MCNDTNIIKMFCKKHTMTQRRLAEMLGKSAYQIWRLANNKVSITDDLKCRLESLEKVLQN